MSEQSHTISALVENRPGVLVRIAGLFARRGFNIKSLTVGETENPDFSRMTIVVQGDEKVLEQITKQLNKLIDVIKVTDTTRFSVVDRELAFIKVGADQASRQEVIQIAQIFRAQIIDISEKSLTVEVTGDEGKLNAILGLVGRFGVIEMVRTGKVTLVRGSQTT